MSKKVFFQFNFLKSKFNELMSKVFLRYSIFQTLNCPISLGNFDVQFWNMFEIMNHYGHETRPTTRYSHTQY